jgi:hypothetical protein
MNFRGNDRKVIEIQNQKVTAQEAGRLARNAYAREWRAKNPDKVRQYNADYWARKASRESIGG